MQCNRFIKILCLALLQISFFSCAQSQELKNKSDKMKKLIYVMDPHCGWCYGNSDNISKLEGEFNDKFEFELLVGGMWTGINAPKGGEGFNTFIKNHSPQMEKTTGAFVGKSFFELTKDTSYTFSSLEPSCAIVLVKELNPNQTIAFAKAVQKAIFAQGKRLDRLETYLPILNNLKIDSKLFGTNWMSEDNLAKTRAEFKRANQIVNGFPTLLLDKNGQQQTVTSGFFNYAEVVNFIK